MRDFHMSREQANRLPIIEGFALLAWNTETNPWCAVERIGDGYIADEAWLIRQSKKPNT
jgi:hypothetical protein